MFPLDSESEVVFSNTDSLSICSASVGCPAGLCRWAAIVESIAAGVEGASLVYDSAAFCKLTLLVRLLSGLGRPSCVWTRRSVGMGVSICSWAGSTTLASGPGEDGGSVADISYVIHKAPVRIQDRSNGSQMLGVSYAALVLMCGSLFNRDPFDRPAQFICGGELLTNHRLLRRAAKSDISTPPEVWGFKFNLTHLIFCLYHILCTLYCNHGRWYGLAGPPGDMGTEVEQPYCLSIDPRLSRHTND